MVVHWGEHQAFVITTKQQKTLWGLGSRGQVSEGIPFCCNCGDVIELGSEVIDIVVWRRIDNINLNHGPAAWIEADVVRDPEGEVVLPCRIGSHVKY